jgi:predicted glutamine amidotransferase
MCRLVAYAGPPVFLDTLLIHPPASLVSQSHAARLAKTIVNGDGCGIGWYGERPEPGVYRGTLPAWSDANLVSLCHQIRASLFLAHVRSATFGEVATANCHPFAAGRHLFMHNGQIGDYAHLRSRIEALITDALYPLRRGTSDSEVIFLAALGRGLEADLAAALSATMVEILAGHRQVVGRLLTRVVAGRATRDDMGNYAAMAAPVTSAQVAKAWLRAA